MFKVNLAVILIALTVIFLVYLAVGVAYLRRRIDCPAPRKDPFQKVLYRFMPDLDNDLAVDVYYLFKIGAMILLAAGCLYVLLFRITIPFVWQPLLDILA
jgi:hypothetical protein